MARRSIVVIGASAGGLPVLRRLTAKLNSLDAAVFVVLHIPPDRSSFLHKVLTSAGASLPVFQISDSQPFRNGAIYVPVPDRHLIVEPGRVRSVRGPAENRFRPSIDVLFRSAAYAYGPQVIGVILSGMLTDGVAGLRAIKQRGGTTIVQQPNDAAFPMMPRAALRTVEIDAAVKTSDLARVIMEESNKPALPAEEFPISNELELEVRIAKQHMNASELLDAVERIGKRSIYSCPDCHGALWEIGDDLMRYRCHIGHAFSAEALEEGQSSKLEEALWSAARALEEKVQLSRRLASGFGARGLEEVARDYEDRSRMLEERANTLRNFILSMQPAD